MEFLFAFITVCSVFVIGILVFNLRKVKRSLHEMNLNYAQLNAYLNSNVQYAKKLASGDFLSEVSVSEQDVLGFSLLEMSKNLKTAKVQEETREWSSTGLSKLGDIIRNSNHIQNINELSTLIISYLVKYIGANQGGLFVLDDSDKSNVFVEMKACYAYERIKYVRKKISLNEDSGLLGEAILEKESIYLTNIPQDYVEITSGLGGSSPKSILIVPLKSNELVVGVIEFASFGTIESYQIQFLERASEIIAVSIINTKNNDNMKRLLSESMNLAEQQNAQTEELRQNMEELEATQEEMVRKENEIKLLLEKTQKNEIALKDKIDEITEMERTYKVETEKMLADIEENRMMMRQVINQLPEKIFLKDEQKRIVILNQSTVDSYEKGYTIDDLIGKNDFDTHAYDVALGYANFEDQVIKEGKTLRIKEEVPLSNGELKYVHSIKMPFVFSDKRVGLLGYQVDITDKINLEKELSSMKLLVDLMLLNVSDMVWYKDISGEYLQISSSLSDYLKIENQVEAYGKTDFDFFNKESAQYLHQKELELINSESNYQSSKCLLKKQSGDPLEGVIKQVLLRDKVGKGLKIISTFTPVYSSMAYN